MSSQISEPSGPVTVASDSCGHSAASKMSDREGHGSLHFVSFAFFVRKNFQFVRHSRGECHMRDGVALILACLRARPRGPRLQAHPKNVTKQALMTRIGVRRSFLLDFTCFRRSCCLVLSGSGVTSSLNDREVSVSLSQQSLPASIESAEPHRTAKSKKQSVFFNRLAPAAPSAFFAALHPHRFGQKKNLLKTLCLPSVFFFFFDFSMPVFLGVLVICRLNPKMESRKSCFCVRLSSFCTP